MAGKNSKPRAYNVSEWDEHFSLINWSKKNGQENIKSKANNKSTKRTMEEGCKKQLAK